MIAIFHPNHIDFANRISPDFQGAIQENVKLDIPDDLNAFPDGSEAPECLVGVSTTDPGRYQVFKFKRDMSRVGYDSTGKTLGNLYMLYPAASIR